MQICMIQQHFLCTADYLLTHKSRYNTCTKNSNTNFLQKLPNIPQSFLFCFVTALQLPVNQNALSGSTRNLEIYKLLYIIYYISNGVSINKKKGKYILTREWNEVLLQKSFILDILASALCFMYEFYFATTSASVQCVFP